VQQLAQTAMMLQAQQPLTLHSNLEYKPPVRKSV